MAKAVIAAVRGMRDILPEEISAWHKLEKTAARCFAAYGYGELRTPLVERLELFTRQIGESTDVVQKEMYRFTDNPAAGSDAGPSNNPTNTTTPPDELALRPEATVSTVRALLAAGKQRGGALRVWYGGAMFRRERPQKGRYRQFHQLGAEALGRVSPALDAEQILMQARLWRALGIEKQLRLEINNLGGSEERARHREKLRAYFARHAEQLDDDARRRLHTNPLRILDSKHAKTREIAAAAPSLAAELGDDSRRYVDAVREKLSAAGIAFADNPFLVRGLDYYNLTVYEWTLDGDARRQNAVAGGGRYDGLAEKIGAAALPGCGFALGMERVISLMPPPPPAAPTCFLALTATADEQPAEQPSEKSLDNHAENFADQIAEQCRDAGFSVWRHVDGGNIGRQLKKADAMGARLALIIGGNEIRGGYITIKRLADGEQRKAAATDAAQTIRRLLENAEC